MLMKQLVYAPLCLHTGPKQHKDTQLSHAVQERDSVGWLREGDTDQALEGCC